MANLIGSRKHFCDFAMQSPEARLLGMGLLLCLFPLVPQEVTCVPQGFMDCATQHIVLSALTFMFVTVTPLCTAYSNPLLSIYVMDTGATPCVVSLLAVSFSK